MFDIESVDKDRGKIELDYSFNEFNELRRLII